MALSLCVLASGSSGNCTYVASGGTRVLVDAGLSYKETAARLEKIGVAPTDINAICVTHEHEDHVGSLGVFSRRSGIAMYANSGTVQAIEQAGKVTGVSWNIFENGNAFVVGDLTVEPFSVPHDSYDPVGFVISCAGVRAGVVTDMGVATGLIRERLRRCQVVVVEANHDEEMLKKSDRPWPLKQRIAGRQGHLSNGQAGELLAGIAGDGLKIVFLAHLSGECNTPKLAISIVEKALKNAGHGEIVVKMTYPDQVSELVSLA